MTLERRRTEGVGAIGIGCEADGECAAELNGDVGWDAAGSGGAADDGLLSGLLSVDEEDDLKRLAKEKGLLVVDVVVDAAVMVGWLMRSAAAVMVLTDGRMFSLPKWSLTAFVLGGWPVKVAVLPFD